MEKLQEHSLLTSLTTASLWGVNYADEVCEKNRHGNKLIINDVRKPILQSFPPSSYTILSSTRLIKRGMLLSSFFLYTFYVYSKLRSLQHLLMMLTVVFSKHRSRWWCCISKMSSFVSLSSLPLAARAAILASAAFFLDTKAAPDVALAICIRASRAFWN